MARRAAGLTAAAVKAAKPGRYGDGNGLYLLVRPAGGKFWLFRYTPQGAKMREMGLGRAGYSDGEVPLADAREVAGQLIKQVRAGIDPLAQREAETKAKMAEDQRAVVEAITFRQVAGHYLSAHEKAWRNPKHRDQWANTLETYAHPHFGDLPVGAIETGHVLAALEPIWRVKPETAARVRGRIENVLDYGKSRGWRDGENPARWRGHLSFLLPARSKIAPVEHHPALPWSTTNAFLVKLRSQNGTAAQALEFTILTAARTGEVLGAKWDEIDLAKRVWTVPAGRMKARREHRVPLNSTAITVLTKLAAMRTVNSLDAFVFPGAALGRALSGMSMNMLLRRMDHGDITVHGFRSTFRDWASEATSFPREVAEAALAHTVGNAVEAAYRRGDLFEKRRLMMEAWATYCDVVAGDGRVIPLVRAGEPHA